MQSSTKKTLAVLIGAGSAFLIQTSVCFAPKSKDHFAMRHPTAVGASQSKSTETKKSPWGLTTYFDFQGSPVGEPTRATKPTATGADSGAPIDFYNSTKLGFKMTESGKFFANPRWLFQPVKSHDFTLLNARAGYQQSNIASVQGRTGKFLFKKADLHTELPTSQSSRLARLTLALGSGQTVEFSNDSRWKVSMDTYFRVYFYNNPLPIGSDLKFGFFPNLTYKISSVTTAKLGYEHEFAHDRVYQEEPHFKLRRIYSCLKPMAEISINKNWGINPYASLAVGDKVNLKSTFWGFEFAGSFF